jgi:choline transport protein
MMDFSDERKKAGEDCMAGKPRCSSTETGDRRHDTVAAGQIEELRRDFSVWSLGSLCLCLMATWEALSSVVAAALANGGAPCLFYN